MDTLKAISRRYRGLGVYVTHEASIPHLGPNAKQPLCSSPHRKAEHKLPPTRLDS